jgi:hypothetical protein
LLLDQAAQLRRRGDLQSGQPDASLQDAFPLELQPAGGAVSQMSIESNPIVDAKLVIDPRCN